MNKINFKKISYKNSHIEILYELLKNRKFSISHRTLPSYESHKKFIKENPYHIWYFVFNENEVIGTVYIHKNNSIGINLLEISEELITVILEFVISNHTPQKEIKSSIPNFFYINVSSENHELASILKGAGLKKIQETFEIKI